MSEPFLAEVRIVGFNFAPRGWAFCDGQILPINQNQSLYSLLGTSYGGDGRTSFALPELRGRSPIHVGNGHAQAEKSGQEGVTLNTADMPAHIHAEMASSDAVSSSDPTNRVTGTNAGKPYHSDGTAANMAADMLTNAGGGQAHNNMQPYLAVNYCIALRGLFPSRN